MLNKCILLLYVGVKPNYVNLITKAVIREKKKSQFVFFVKLLVLLALERFLKSLSLSLSSIVDVPKLFAFST